MILATTAGQVVVIALGGIFLVAVHVMAVKLCYKYFTDYFLWMPKWLRVTLASGGLVTYVFYVMGDEHIHRSMGGENSRSWKNDPDNGVYILSHKEVRRQMREGTLQVVSDSDDNHAR